MSAIAKNNRIITIIYDSNTSIGKQALAYLQATKKEIKAFDISKASLTGTQWAEVAKGLDKMMGEIVQKNHGDFKKKFGSNSVDFDFNDWVRILQNESNILKQPILVVNKHFFQITSPSEIMHFLEAQSAAIKKPYNKEK
ncbi:arsenate reductase family protein [Maribacter aestuarii]|uniref:arsenate reductase family protein n=1 Tax=Maribacter aestuarii TaxID=1130723 RepID=UPI00248CF0CC|nr:hypothetical protein [Maribacter aestuarii]